MSCPFSSNRIHASLMTYCCSIFVIRSRSRCFRIVLTRRKNQSTTQLRFQASRLGVGTESHMIFVNALDLVTCSQCIDHVTQSRASPSLVWLFCFRTNSLVRLVSWSFGVKISRGEALEWMQGEYDLERWRHGVTKTAWHLYSHIIVVFVYIL